MGVPKVLKMQELAEQSSNGKAAHTLAPVTRILPDPDEEHASLAMVNRWVELADAALADKNPRKIA